MQYNVCTKGKVGSSVYAPRTPATACPYFDQESKDSVKWEKPLKSSKKKKLHYNNKTGVLVGKQMSTTQILYHGQIPLLKSTLKKHLHNTGGALLVGERWVL